MMATSTSYSLCLACSASLPPRNQDSVFYTKCCSQPICPTCVANNPRLTRYDPCLRCGLAGIYSNSYSASHRTSTTRWPPTEDDLRRVNVDGALRDDDIFVVEDDDPVLVTDEVAADTYEDRTARWRSKGAGQIRHFSRSQASQSSYGSSSASTHSPPFNSPQISEDTDSTPDVPTRYTIQPEDTLLGISLKLGVDSRILCRLNNLPQSTLRTTPRLLHTRSFLVLPPSERLPLPLSHADQVLHDERRTRPAAQRTETRFWAVARPAGRDIALAGRHEDDAAAKKKVENGLRKRNVHAQGEVPGEELVELSRRDRTADRDSDDEEQETRLRGRKAGISFPYFSSSNRPAGSDEQNPWWRWRN